MTDFILTEDFPKNEAEFDERFSNEQTCYDYQDFPQKRGLQLRTDSYAGGLEK